MSSFTAEVVKKVQDLYKEWGTDNFSSADFHAGLEFGISRIIEQMEEWCGINAYDSDRGPCDEHTVDDSRGIVCSANELMETIKLLVRK